MNIYENIDSLPKFRYIIGTISCFVVDISWIGRVTE